MISSMPFQAMDQLFGGNGDDSLFGGLGNDMLNGGRGDDALYGNSGDDLIRGRGGNDLLVGNSGDDDLRGSGGNDVLIGGAGADRLNGGNGADEFRFNAISAGEDDADEIIDFESGIDTIRIENAADREFLFRTIWQPSRHLEWKRKARHSAKCNRR